MFEFRCLYSLCTSCMLPRWLRQLDKLVIKRSHFMLCLLLVHFVKPVYNVIICLLASPASSHPYIDLFDFCKKSFLKILVCGLLKLVTQFCIYCFCACLPSMYANKWCPTATTHCSLGLLHKNCSS